jgi:hypothetical protein
MKNHLEKESDMEPNLSLQSIWYKTINEHMKSGQTINIVLRAAEPLRLGDGKVIDIHKNGLVELLFDEALNGRIMFAIDDIWYVITYPKK